MSREIEIKTIKQRCNQSWCTYGNETWAMTEIDVKRLGTWERQTLRGISGPMVEQGMWRIRISQELRELYKDLDIVADIIKKNWNGLDKY
jgi:hypothetical protein